MLQYIDTAQDNSGNALIGATIKVLNYPSGTNAQIFSDNGLTPIAGSQVTTDATGQFNFFAADADYTLQFTYQGTLYKTQSPVSIFDGAAQVTFTDTGSVNAYAIADSALEKTLRTGLRCSVKITTTSTGASTLQYNGLAVKPIVYPGGTALTAASLTATGIYQFEYDGASWQLRNSQAAPFYAITAAETAAAVTIVDSTQLPGSVDRYGTNTTPGTTDMSAALQAAVNQMLNTGGAPCRFGSSAYSIVTPPTFGGASTLMLPIDIGGNGAKTQVIHNGPASTGALFDLSTRNGWYLHDLWITGNTVHKNDGIYAGNSSATEAIRWRVENVTAFMAGVGLKIQNTNTGVVRNFRSWPNNPPTLQVPQAVTLTDISHHMYVTGGFGILISFLDCDCLPSASYAANQRGLKIDCASAAGITVIGGDYESNGGANTETGIDIQPSGSGSDLLIQGVYVEGTKITLKNVQKSRIGPVANGSIGGSLVLVTGVTQNEFTGVQVVTIDNQDTSNFGNTWIGCGATTTWNQNENQNNFTLLPNRYIGCNIAGQQLADRGLDWCVPLTYSANISSDTYNGNTFVIRVSNGTAFTINAPAHPYNGQIVKYRLRNESGGAMGAVTWSGFGSPPWTNPANTFNRTAIFQFDNNFGTWVQQSYSHVDVPN